MAAPLEQIVGGKYEILEKLREGGMGAIYRVRHRLLEEVRVIKVLHPQLALDEKLRQRFQNEAKVAIKLRHPNIAHLFDFSVDESGVAYIVMEFIDGVTLHELVEASGPPSLGLGVEIGRQCLDAMGYLHQQGFVHRDIASDNLMLTTDFKDDPLVKLIDLGIAKGLESSSLTATGMFMGKGRYAAPEQFSKGAGELDQRSDIYSFGVLFYELLTGHSPVSGDDFSEVVAGHLFRPPMDFEESDPTGKVPPGLRTLILHALEKDPDDRIGTAAEFAEQLAEFGRESPSQKAEFSDALKTTTNVRLSDLRPAKPGSTQERLDRQFLLDEESKGEKPQLTVVEGDPASPPTELGKRLPTGPPKRGVLLAGVAALLVAVLASAVWLWSSRAGGGAPVDVADAAAGPRLVVEVVEPFVPSDAPGESGLDIDGVAIPEPDDGAESAADSTPPATRPEPRRNPPPPPIDPRRSPPGGAAGPPPGARPPGQQGPPPPGPRVAPPDQPGELYSPGPGVRPPRIVDVPDPVLPDDTKPPRDPFEIVVAVLVNEEGRALTSRIVSAPLFKRRFRDAATEAAMAGSFEPPTKAGVPGKMWLDLTFRFGSG